MDPLAFLLDDTQTIQMSPITTLYSQVPDFVRASAPELRVGEWRCGCGRIKAATNPRCASCGWVRR